MKSPERPLLECRNVWKIYNEGTPAEVRAIQDASLKIRKGEFVAIQGPSGSGKSTLLQCIGCLDTPTRGKIFISGQDTSKMSQDELTMIRRKSIGFVFQFFNIIPTLTALQNVELPMVFDNVSDARRKQRAKQLLDKVGLGKRAHHKPSELSGGETQRVAIARALANNPIIVFADEPTGNLDSKSGREIIDIFKKLNKEGKTVAMITHDAYVARYAKRKIKLKDGMIIK